MSTTAAMITALKARFDDANGDVVSSTQWLAYLQEAYDEGNSWNPNWPWLESRITSVSITAGMNTWTPTDTTNLRVLSVLNATDDYPLAPLEGRGQVRYQFPDVDETGSPVAYRVFNNTLEVYPIADATKTYYVEYMAFPAALADSDSSVPVWPAQFHRLLLNGALVRAYEDDGNPDMANLHRAHFEAGLVKMEETALSGLRTESYPAINDDLY